MTRTPSLDERLDQVLSTPEGKRSVRLLAVGLMKRHEAAKKHREEMEAREREREGK